jgi:Glyoxalase/Bleomycin resistance protein/Dioxygenase superfamily
LDYCIVLLNTLSHLYGVIFLGLACLIQEYPTANVIFRSSSNPQKFPAPQNIPARFLVGPAALGDFRLATSFAMPPPVPGTDSAQPNSTVGWKLNHACFRIRDPEATTHFYRDVLGMRTIFTADCGSFTILYFGYPEIDGVHETGAEMLKKRHNREGLIEFIHIHVFQIIFVSDFLE